VANETPLSKLVVVRSRFSRSVSLPRDWEREDGLDGYILTPSGREIVGRLAAAICGASQTRAWSLTGPYGSGKSAFALFASQLLGGRGKAGRAARKLVEAQDAKLWRQLFQGMGSLTQAGLLCPVLITGSRTPLESTIANGVLEGIRAALGRVPRSLAKRLEELSVPAAEGRRTNELVSALEEAVEFVSTTGSGYQGLLLVIDELGKLLEYAASHPEEGDVFALQTLAEAASRSEKPFLLLTILHQAIDRYTAHISPSRRQEWAKVQGRFEDIAFEEPTEQVLRLMAQALEHTGPKPIKHALEQKGRELAGEAWSLNARVGGIERRELVDLLAACMPLHPTVSLILGPLFRRLAQNERSLFAFLTSGEPFGFQEFLRRQQWDKAGGEVYRLDQLYDYVSTALGRALYSQHRGKYWSEVQSVLEQLHKADALQVRVAKAIGLVQALGYSAGVPASDEFLRFALRSGEVSEKDVDAAITALVGRSVLVYRRHAGSYALWEGSDVNIDARLEEGRRAVDPSRTLTAYLGELVPPRALVARRHSHRTGTLRYFEVTYADRASLPGLLQKGFADTDGRVIHCLPLNPDDRDDMETMLTDGSLADRPAVIAALPRELFDLKEACQELACLRWVTANTPELAGDATARREMRARIGAAEAVLTEELRRIFIPAGRGGQQCRWFRGGAKVNLPSLRSLNEFLSAVCDEVYSSTPQWRNELINRRQLSTSAAAARRNLIEAMIEHPDVEALGLQGFPPERSMYESILRAPGLHRLKAGKWGFCRPLGKADRALESLWKGVERFFAGTAERRRSVSELFQLLSAAPFGLKDGVLPVLFAAALQYYDTEAALYENGTFVPMLTIAVFERLMHAPELFEVQHCRVSGPRAVVFSKYATMLSKAEEATDTTKPKLLTVVRPLVRFVRQLPDYVGNTQQLSNAAQGVYKAIRETREPDQLLFADLPRACGSEPFSVSGTADAKQVDSFFATLRLALVELQQAYPKLQSSIEQVLFKAFSLTGPLTQARNELMHRARLVSELSVEVKLKSFLVRVLDVAGDDVTWLESIAALLGGKPPQVWNDQERARFEVNTTLMARTFHHFESLAFEAERAGVALLDGDAQAIRVAVTVPHSEELERVVRIPANLSQRAGQAQKRLRQVLDEVGVLKDRELSVAVLAQLVRELLGAGSAETADA
jgi:hypothetical protein